MPSRPAPSPPQDDNASDSSSAHFLRSDSSQTFTPTGSDDDETGFEYQSQHVEISSDEAEPDDSGYQDNVSEARPSRNWLWRHSDSDDDDEEPPSRTVYAYRVGRKANFEPSLWKENPRDPNTEQDMPTIGVRKFFGPVDDYVRARAQEEFDFIVAADARAGVGVSTSYAEMLRNYERRREERPAHSDSED